jgi:predicted GNAT family N-acyltransferase
MTPTTLSEAQAMALLPASVRSMVEKYKRQDQQARESMISTLTTAQSVYNEERLKSMSTDQLEETYALLGLSVVAGPVDYSGRGFPRVEKANEGDDEYIVPDAWGLDSNAKPVKTN